MRAPTVLLIAAVACGSSARPPELRIDTRGDASAPPADAAAVPIDTPELDAFFEARMQTAQVPGIAVAVIDRRGDTAWAKGYGLADIEASRPATADTLFMLASVSKTVMAVALMQLLADPSRGLTLDTDINDPKAKLPFAVHNPNHPGDPITFRQLLTHTSSLVDGGWFDNFRRRDEAAAAPGTERGPGPHLVPAIRTSS